MLSSKEESVGADPRKVAGRRVRAGGRILKHSIVSVGTGVEKELTK